MTTCSCPCTCSGLITIEDRGTICRQCVLGGHDPRGDRAREAACLTIREGGATLVRETLLPVKPPAGYAVGMARNTAAMAPSYDPEAIATAILAVWRKYPDATHVGTWVTDAMIVCVDPVTIVDHLDKALSLARANRQVAIYDFAKGKDLMVEPEVTESELRLLNGDR